MDCRVASHGLDTKNVLLDIRINIELRGRRRMKTSVLKTNGQLVISTLLVVFSVLLFASTTKQAAAAEYNEKLAFCTDITANNMRMLNAMRSNEIFDTLFRFGSINSMSNYEQAKAFNKCMENAGSPWSSTLSTWHKIRSPRRILARMLPVSKK